MCTEYHLRKRTLKIAGVILMQGTKVLVAERDNSRGNTGRCEFPGGKLEASETFAEAGAREFMEELSIEVNPKDMTSFAKFTHEFSNYIVSCEFFITKIWRGKAKLKDHSKVRFVEIKDLLKYDFTEADLYVAKKLQSEEIPEYSSSSNEEFRQELTRAVVRGTNKLSVGERRELLNDVLQGLSSAARSYRANDKNSRIQLNQAIATFDLVTSQYDFSSEEVDHTLEISINDLTHHVEKFIEETELDFLRLVEIEKQIAVIFQHLYLSKAATEQYRRALEILS